MIGRLQYSTGTKLKVFILWHTLYTYHTDIYIYICMDTHNQYIYMYIYIYICMYTYIKVSISVYIYIGFCVCANVDALIPTGKANT